MNGTLGKWKLRVLQTARGDRGVEGKEVLEINGSELTQCRPKKIGPWKKKEDTFWFGGTERRPVTQGRGSALGYAGGLEEKGIDKQAALNRVWTMRRKYGQGLVRR